MPNLSSSDPTTSVARLGTAPSRATAGPVRRAVGPVLPR